MAPCPTPAVTPGEDWPSVPCPAVGAIEAAGAPVQSGGTSPGGAGCGPNGAWATAPSEASQSSLSAVLSSPIAARKASSSVTPS